MAAEKDKEERSKSRRKAFLLRLDPDLLAEIRTWASHELRSVNAHIEFLLRDAVRRRRGGRDRDDG